MGSGATKSLRTFAPVADNPVAKMGKLEKSVNRIYQKMRQMPFNMVFTWEGIEHLLKKSVQNVETFERHLLQACPIMHTRIQPLLRDFIRLKQSNGNPVEKKVFAAATPATLIQRFLRCRPVMFMTGADTYILRNSQRGSGGFDQIGTDREHAELSLGQLMSYEEMAMSALVSVGGPAQFINTGDRHNNGRMDTEGTFVADGVYVGCVGARFERPEKMEWRHMVVSKDQNVPDKGYGPPEDAHHRPSPMLQAWANLYGVKYFPLYSEVLKQFILDIDSSQSRFQRVQNQNYFLDRQVYRARMELTISPFLCHANRLAAAQERQAYVHVVGLGLGVWMLDPVQVKDQVSVFARVLEQKRFKHISDLDFSWFGSESVCGGSRHGEKLHGVTIHFSRRNVADPLPDPHKLLVAQYAWDSNAFPGNEYWQGQLSASGDPAAAACSTIPLIHNVDFNPGLLDLKRAQVYPDAASAGGDATASVTADGTATIKSGSVHDQSNL